MKKFAFTLMILNIAVFSRLAGASVRPWARERANQWQQQTGWLVGCNFIPSTAINQLEMWQADTFDPNTIDKELAMAEGLGFNCMRVFLHYLVWQENPEAFKNRIDNFLGICEKHTIRVMFVLFDDCWYGNAQLGKQPSPDPGLHNSFWLQCPRYAEVTDRKMWPVFEQYTKDIVGRFGRDSRVVVWDLYNEPGNNHFPDENLPLVKKVFAWARQANPSQPLTTGVWKWDPDSQALNSFVLKSSDIITFHSYGKYENMKKDIHKFKSFGRPVICTEYLARGFESRFETHLPMMKAENVGAINWGLVYGKTQTIFPWDAPLHGLEPNLWHHDIFRKDGRPYDSDEIRVIKGLTGKK